MHEKHQAVIAQILSKEVQLQQLQVQFNFSKCKSALSEHIRLSVLFWCVFLVLMNYA